MSTAVSIVRTLLGLLFDHTIGNIVRMVPIIRLPKLERGPVSRGFLALLLVILFFGLTMLFSASYSSAYATSGKLYSIIKPQVIIAIVGLFFMWVLSNINYRALRLMSESLYIITIVLLILALLSPEDTNGTYRWVYLPGGASFQPSELAKFSLMIWTADMLDRDYDKKNRLWYGAIKPALPLLPILYLLHKEPHNSAMILLCLIFATMLICTLSPGRWLLPLIPACAVAGSYFLKGLAPPRAVWTLPGALRRWILPVWGGRPFRASMPSPQAACSAWASARACRSTSGCPTPKMTLSSASSVRSWASSAVLSSSVRLRCC